MNMEFNEEFRFGSAAWAELHEVKRAGLFTPQGPQIGFLSNKPIHLAGDAPMLTIGGAGSGKLRDLLSYVVCNSPGQRMMVLDPRGELAAISQIAHTLHGEYAYTWNPMHLLGLPAHSCNPLDILRLDTPTFSADCKFVTEALVASSGGKDAKYFEIRARSYIEAIIKADVEFFKTTSLPRAAQLINMIESNPATWADFLELMLSSRFEDVRRTAAEMLAKQQDSPKEFGSIMGELYANLGFLDDPALLTALDGEDFSLADLCHAPRTGKVFLNVPAEYLSLWSPLLRLFFTVAMLYKGRAPQAERLMLIVDEAGQLGSFEALLRAFTFGRGAGVRAWAVFQDAGQIIRNFGGPALQGFMGSAQLRQFFGVRDYQTAELVSKMLGTQTLIYDEPVLQADARHRKQHALASFIQGTGDPFGAAFDIAHYGHKSKQRSKQHRQLMTPDEVLALPEDKQVLFISGKDLRPVLADKHPYFTRAEMAGKFLPNPYHPPADAVRLAMRHGSEMRSVKRERVPYAYRSFPQYQSGTWAYVEGYQPA